VYEEASNQGDVHGLAALYGEDALLLPPDGGIVAGRDSIMEFWQDGLERGLTLDTVRVVARGGDGYVVGTYHVAATDEAAADSGKYVMCFARGDDGWHLMVDTWNATSSDSPDDSENADPRTRIISAATWRARYRFITIDQRPMNSRTVDAHPMTLHRVKSRRMPRSSD
jgi:ketosteroid isomerase-like protein